MAVSTFIKNHKTKPNSYDENYKEAINQAMQVREFFYTYFPEILHNTISKIDYYFVYNYISNNRGNRYLFSCLIVDGYCFKLQRDSDCSRLYCWKWSPHRIIDYKQVKSIKTYLIIDNTGTGMYDQKVGNSEKLANFLERV